MATLSISALSPTPPVGQGDGDHPGGRMDEDAHDDCKGGGRGPPATGAEAEHLPCPSNGTGPRRAGL